MENWLLQAERRDKCVLWFGKRSRRMPPHHYNTSWCSFSPASQRLILQCLWPSTFSVMTRKTWLAYIKVIERTLVLFSNVKSLTGVKLVKHEIADNLEPWSSRFFFCVPSVVAPADRLPRPKRRMSYHLPHLLRTPWMTRRMLFVCEICNT